MNILFVSSFPIEPVTGGVQRVTSILANEFDKLGFSVNCLVMNNTSSQFAFTINHYFLPERGLTNSANKNFYHQLLGELKIDVIINQAGVIKEIVDFVSEKSNYNCKLFTVHHNCIKCLRENFKNIILGSTYGKIIKIFDFNVVWDILLINNKIKYTKYFSTAINKSNKLVLLSEEYKSELNTYLKTWLEDKVVSISNPLPFSIQQVDLRKKENRLVYVGRVEYAQKQTHLLIPIWQQISKKFPDWHLDIVGDGTYLAELKNQSEKKNLINIHYHGYQDPQPFLEKAKIFLMTSSFEGYGMVLVEAQVFGVVPIAFNSFPILKNMLLNFSAGMGVRPFDIDDYVDKLSILICEEETRLLMIYNGYKAADRFIPSTIVQDWIKLFKE